jgi:hypothetical protein
LAVVFEGVFLAEADPLAVKENAHARASNFGQKSIAKAKRKRIFFRIKKRSEAKANPKLFSAKRSEFASLRHFSQSCENCEIFFSIRISENFQNFFRVHVTVHAKII